MVEEFYILGSKTKRPDSRKTIFVDGSGDLSFRPELDLELSHWIPNTTPKEFKADSSTEICMNFIQNSETKGWDLAINNHLDTDGILSVFTVLHQEIAMQHRDTIVQAAEMGDFWQYGDKKAQILFQGLTLLFRKLQMENTDVQHIYEASFQEILRILDGEGSVSQEIKLGLAALEISLNYIHDGNLQREVIHEHFVWYNLPQPSNTANISKFLHIPQFNAILSNDTLILPQARNFFDKEKVQLLSLETNKGYYYDLWYPSYSWAETPHSWQPPGLLIEKTQNLLIPLDYPFLTSAVKELNNLELNSNPWTVATKFNYETSLEGRIFPVILSYLNQKEQKPAISQLRPDTVIQQIAEIFNPST